MSSMAGAVLARHLPGLQELNTVRYVRDAYTHLECSYYNTFCTLELGICMVGSRPDAEPLEAVALIEASFLAAAAA
jgi:hypothetical protein